MFLREITVDENGLHTSSIYHKVTRREYNRRPGTGEFQFQVNGGLAGISPETAALLKNITGNWKLSVKNAPLTEYQLLRYPAPGARGEWDGFARYAKCGRGVICVFRNDYPEDTVNVRLPGFPDGRFALTDMVSDQPLGACSGEELRSGLELAWMETNCRAIAIADIPDSA